eukprot:TRINITY_DN374_c0_g1_i1.p1 TRINITY_DN374_c0_g1~~TRINITY_DN374_c0_g1_i1.p1  ORF type:complete len:190 (+),score=52.77 TRINITY_DN374_c0_g1_i1:68-637(+)
MADQVNQVDVQALIERIRTNDAELTKVNLNSHQALKAGTTGEFEDASPDTAIAIAGAMESNDKVLDLQMARCHVNNDGAKALAHMLEVNKSLQNLNLETNDIGGEGILALIQALKNNETLTELKLTNQLKPIPSDIERSLGPALESNTTLQKIVLTLREQSCRNSIDKIIFRNKDIARKKRVDAARAKK